MDALHIKKAIDNSIRKTYDCVGFSIHSVPLKQTYLNGVTLIKNKLQKNILRIIQMVNFSKLPNKPRLFCAGFTQVLVVKFNATGHSKEKNIFFQLHFNLYYWNLI